VSAHDRGYHDLAEPNAFDVRAAWDSIAEDQACFLVTIREDVAHVEYLHAGQWATTLEVDGAPPRTPSRTVERSLSKRQVCTLASYSGGRCGQTISIWSADNLICFLLDARTRTRMTTVSLHMRRRGDAALVTPLVWTWHIQG
jgi:hypothetical protein